MNLITRISHQVSLSTLSVFRTLTKWLSPRGTIKGKSNVQLVSADYDDGFIRFSRIDRRAFEWGLRFKPFPISGLRVQVTCYTAETGIRFLVTIPFILSFGFMICPARLGKLLRKWRYHPVLIVDLTTISLTYTDDKKPGQTFALIEIDTIKEGASNYGQWSVTLVGPLNDITTYDTRYTDHRSVITGRVVYRKYFITVNSIDYDSLITTNSRIPYTEGTWNDVLIESLPKGCILSDEARLDLTILTSVLNSERDALLPADFEVLLTENRKWTLNNHL